MKSATRTFLTVTEVEPRIVPDATATLLPESIGSTSTTATTLQYVDDPSHPITATTLGFADDPSHPIAATPLTAALPPNETVVTPTPDVPTAILPPADTVPSPRAFDWIDALSDDQIAYLLSLSDADLAAVLFGPTAPESPVTPVAGPSLPADTALTLHGVEVGTGTTTPAANPTVVNTDFQIDPNAPPPTATTLEFTNGQAGQGPLVTTLQNPVQAPQMTPEEALDRLQNRPQIIVDSSTPPVVQTAPAAPVANAVQVGVPTSIRPGDEWLYNTTANGLFVPFMTKTAYAEMIAAGNIANGSTSSGWTFGATFGEIGSVIGSLPNINFVPIVAGYFEAITIFVAPGIALQGPVNTAVTNVETIYTEQRTGENIAGSVVITVAYSIVSVVGLVDLYEAASGTEARSGRELTANERWSRGFLGAGTFLLTLLPFAPSSWSARPAVTGGTADVAAGRAALQAEARASLQAAQAERQAMVPERPAGTPGEGPVPRPEPVPPPVETPVPAERPVPRPEPVPPPVEAPVPVPPPVVSQTVVDAVGQARNTAGGVAGDCENAVSSLIDSLSGGTSRSLTVGEIGFHEVYIYQGQVIDAVAAQYIRNAAMLQQVEQAGLRAAMESGVFTVEEHIQFMRIVRGEQFTLADYIPRGR